MATRIIISGTIDLPPENVQPAIESARPLIEGALTELSSSTAMVKVKRPTAQRLLRNIGIAAAVKYANINAYGGTN